VQQCWLTAPKPTDCRRAKKLQRGWKVCTWADSLRLNGSRAASSADQPKPTDCQVDQKDQVQLSDCSWANRSKLGWQIAGVLDVCSWTHWLLAGCVQRSWQCAAVADRLQASWQFAAKLSCLSWQVAAKLSGWQNAAGCYACSIDMLKALQEIQWLQTNGSCSILHLAILTSAVSSNLFLTLKKSGCSILHLVYPAQSSVHLH